MSDPLPRVKEPHLAGRWYPADAAALASRVREWLDAGVASGDACALVAPHGPFEQSGAVAAAAWAAARPPRRAIVLGPSHYVALRGACVLPVAGYRTPLGVTPLDAPALEALVRSGGVRANPAVFMREHAIEAQLPFLQTRAPDAALVPVLVGTLEPAEAVALAAALRALLDGETLLVASSDLTHYGRRWGFLPVASSDVDGVRATMRALDDELLACLVAGDADALERWAADSGAVVCGRQALEVLLRALPAGARAACVARASSLDAGAAADAVVGYGAVVWRGAEA